MVFLPHQNYDSNIFQYYIIVLSTNQPINQSTNQPINQSTNQPINQSTNQPINQSTNQPYYEIIIKITITHNSKFHILNYVCICY